MPDPEDHAGREGEEIWRRVLERTGEEEGRGRPGRWAKEGGR